MKKQGGVMGRNKIFKNPERKSILVEKDDWNVIKNYMDAKKRFVKRNGSVVKYTASLLISDLVKGAARYIKTRAEKGSPLTSDFNMEAISGKVIQIIDKKLEKMKETTL